MLTSGHQLLIDTGLSLCDNLLILVGSSDKENTVDNPFSYELRKEIINTIYPSIIVRPLPDIGVGNCFKWGDYVLENANKYLKSVDCIIYGKEEKHHTWFNDEIKKHIDMVEIDRSIINISATELREYLLRNEKEKWMANTSPSIHKYYEKLRNILLNINS